jgi:arylsulfatase A-like enzyme
MGIERTFTLRDAKLVAPGNLTPDQTKQWEAYYGPRNQAFTAANLSGKELVRWRYNRYMHDYLACVKAVDEAVGKMLDYLDSEGIADQTVVIVSSDQGFFLGEHGWFDKRWIFEESLRSPLLARWPGVTKPSAKTDSIVSLLDFSQTFLDIAGQPQPSEMQGRSLVPLLKGETPTDWRTSLYYHYYEFPVPHRVRPHYGVVTDRYKLIHYYAPDVDDWELLDRQADPLEVKNFYDDPAYANTVKELASELTRLKTEVKDDAPTPRKAFGNQPFAGEQPTVGSLPKGEQRKKNKRAAAP